MFLSLGFLLYVTFSLQVSSSLIQYLVSPKDNDLWIKHVGGFNMVFNQHNKIN
jgi:hypothetical protein